MSLMLQEIHEQPEAIRRTLDRNAAQVSALCEEIKRREIRMVTIAGRGTSDHAAILGRYLFEVVNGIPASLAAGSVLTMYGTWPRVDSSLVIGISQSGESREVVEVLQRSREMGALTLGITNCADSGVANTAEHVLLLHAGAEKSVAATKTYTATLAALYSIVAGLPGNHPLAEGLAGKVAQVPELISKVLGMTAEIEQRMERYRFMKKCIVVSRGLNMATAYETALKMCETGYIVARGFSAANLMHGPVASVDPGSTAFLFAPSGQVLENLRQTARVLDEKGIEQVVVSSDPDVLGVAATPVRIPFAVDEAVSPFVYIVAGQLMAHALAVGRGCDPDHPRGLQKVTYTR
ncbi:MAG TPA: SIS domain-containing protein [Armatimonadetes bacterium]|nr:SIS domain-containing protein [Armatimonadota bacterium]